MADIFKYGKVLRAYKAQGNLQLDTGASFRCSFRAASFIDGAIHVECDFEQCTRSEIISLHSLLCDGVAIHSINGMTEDKQEVIVERNLLWNDINFKTCNESLYLIVAFIAGKLIVKQEGIIPHLNTLRFGVTNFKFEGNTVREQKTGSEHSLDRGILSVNLDFGKMIIEKMPDYEEIMRNLKALQGIEPTCEILLELSQGDDIKWATNIVDSVCMILSLAKGTKITWIYLDGFDTNNAKCYTLHKYGITRPYAGVSESIIGSMPPEDITELIHEAIPRYPVLNNDYKLGQVIDIYLEGKRPNSFLESKALAAIQAMELLVGIYAKKRDLIFIVDEKVFSSNLKEMANEIREVFKLILGESYVSDICGENNEKLAGLNRLSFRQGLRNLFSQFGLIVNSQILNQIILTRNALVHGGSFNTTNRIQEYHRLISITGRLLLKMLGYEGYILDCENNWVRIKLR